VREILDDIASAVQTEVTSTSAGGGMEAASCSEGERPELEELSNIVKDNSAAVRQIAAREPTNAGIARSSRRSRICRG